MASQDTIRAADTAQASWINDPKIRALIYQILVVALLSAFVYWIVGNTLDNLRRANIGSGFAFLQGRAGFDIAQTVLEYTSNSTFGRALVIGGINTAVVAVCGIVTATIVGFLVGVGRLSNNWLIRRICEVYVELFRNIPPLLVIFFWYFGVLSVLPQPRESLEMPFNIYLNSRGFFVPSAIFAQGIWLVVAAFFVAVALSWFVKRKAHQRQMATGERFPVFLTSVALIVGLPLLAFFLAGRPITFEAPVLGAFNLTGGLNIKPEFLSLYLALSFYTASFIAEIVRAGILGVNKGQTEAAHALGIRAGPTLRLVIVPQAMRIIIPPLTSQYLNLTKNSSLAVAIGYPDLVAIGQTTMNQTGQAIEVVAIWMVVYLGLSLSTSAFMNWFNAKMALVER